MNGWNHELPNRSKNQLFWSSEHFLPHMWHPSRLTKILLKTSQMSQLVNCRFSTETFWRLVFSHEWFRINLQQDEVELEMNSEPRISKMLSWRTVFSPTTLLWDIGKLTAWSGIFPRPYGLKACLDFHIATMSIIYKRHQKWRHK